MPIDKEKYTDDFQVTFCDRSYQVVRAYSFSQLLFNVKRPFSDVVSIFRIQRSKYEKKL